MSFKLQASSFKPESMRLIRLLAHSGEEDLMQDFKNLKVWQKSHALTLDVYRTTLLFPWFKCKPLIQQLQSSALSVESNIMEGATRGGDVEFRRFARMALSSACELEGQLLVARDLKYLAMELFDRMSKICEEIRKMLWALILRLGGDRP